MEGRYHKIAIQMAKAKVSAVRRNLNACEYVNKFLLCEYNVRAEQLSVLTGEPIVVYKRKKTRRMKEKSK